MYDFFGGKAPDHLLNIMNFFKDARTRYKYRAKSCKSELCQNFEKQDSKYILQFMFHNSLTKITLTLYYDLVHCLIKEILGKGYLYLKFSILVLFWTKILPPKFFNLTLHKKKNDGPR